jgi:hypothetical protein
MGRHTRKSEINRRRQRRQKLSKIRKRHAAAKNDSERTKQVDRLRRVSSGLTEEWFKATAAPATEKA